MQHPEGSSAVRLTGVRGEKETSKETETEGRGHQNALFQGTGRRAIYPDIKRAPASRRETQVLELVPRASLAVLRDLFYV